MSLKQNWHKTPMIPYRTIEKILVVIWAVIVVWMMILGDNPVVILIAPVLGLGIVYLIARLGP